MLAAGVNHLSVTIDGSENPGIPPFGHVIDYLTYAGLYREAWLEVSAPIFIANVKIETPDVLDSEKRLTAQVWLGNPQVKPLTGKLVARLMDGATQVSCSGFGQVMIEHM